MRTIEEHDVQRARNQIDRDMKPQGSRVIYGLLLLIGACTPLLFIPGLNNSIELPRAVFSRGGAALVLLLFVLFAPSKSNIFRNDHGIFVGLVVVLAALLVGATICSVDVSLSLWGEYQSQFGLFTWLSLLILCISTLAVVNTPWRRFLFIKVLIGSSAIIILYGLVRTILQGTIIWESAPLSDIRGLISLSDHISSYLPMMIPLTLAELFIEDRRWPFALILVSQIVLLTITQVQSAWAGAVVAVLVFGLLRLYIVGKKKLARNITMAGLTLTLLLALFLVLIDFPGSLTSPSSFDVRSTIWRTTTKLITGRLLFGYGPDVGRLAFQEIYPLDLVDHLGFQPAIASASNLWLDIGLGIGLVGLAAYVFLLVSAGRLLWQRLASGKQQYQQLLLAGITSALIGHIVALQFSVETVATAVVFWLLIGIGLAVDSPLTNQSSQSQSRTWKYIPLALASLILIGLLTIPPVLADRAYKQGQELHPAWNLELERYVEATQQWPIEPVYHLALAEEYWAAGQPAAASSELVSTAEQHLGNAELWVAVGDLYYRWGVEDPDRFSLSQAAYRRAVELAPDTASYHVALGQVLAENGRSEDAVREIERALAINPFDVQAMAILDQLSEPAAHFDGDE